MDPKEFVLLHPSGQMPLGGVEKKDADAAKEETMTWRKMTWKRFCQNKAAVYSMFIFLLIVLIAISTCYFTV